MKNSTSSVEEATRRSDPGHVPSTLQNETVIELRRRKLQEVIEAITADGGGLRMADNLPRLELYDRARARSEVQAINPFAEPVGV